MAPEVYNREPYNEKVDMYSFGIILYQILSGCTPFAGLSVNSFEAKVIRGGYR
jgi:serine/threonine protein kinase